MQYKAEMTGEFGHDVGHVLTFLKSLSREISIITIEQSGQFQSSKLTVDLNMFTMNCIFDCIISLISRIRALSNWDCFLTFSVKDAQKYKSLLNTFSGVFINQILSSTWRFFLHGV